MKLGVVAEADRADDSPDTIVVVEPAVGSVARSKGQLYLIATSTVASSRTQEATQLVAETIEREYYYDESAGIRVCLQKALATINKRLLHHRERLGLHGTEEAGPIGVGVAVVRGNELYVATIGPAEAYLIRQARLSTLPDPHRDRGLPTVALEPDVWRGEISVGDSLVLISPNAMSRLGPDELKDAMLTLHPQSAIEHLHRRFVEAGGTGSDAILAIEATEVPATQRARTLVPVRAAEPLAGAPDRSPIPLADNVTDGVAAVQAGAGRARAAAGGMFDGVVRSIQDLLPRRQTAYRRVTPAATRREAQRRAAVAVLAFVIVAAGLGTSVVVVGGLQGAGAPLASLSAGEAALKVAKDNVDQVFAPGVDLVAADRERATQLLTQAFTALKTAEDAGMASSRIKPLRDKAINGLDRIYGVVPIAPTSVVAFGGGDVAYDFGGLILGPDGAPFILDRATKRVYRVDSRAKKASIIIGEGTKAAGATAAAPKLMAVGARDLLILDANNVLWRWRPANNKGRGTLTRVRVEGSASWGSDVLAMGTFLRDPNAGLYNLYVLDPSEEQILRYSPARDGNGFPSDPTDWLAVARQVEKMTDLYVDGDIFVTENGEIVRFVNGKSEGWEASPPGDDILRSAPRYSAVDSATDKRVGKLYAYDKPNQRIVAIDKANGSYVEQYRIIGHGPQWADIRGFYIVRGIEDAPDTIVWVTKDGLFSALLEAVKESGPSPAPGGSKPPASGPPSSGAPRSAPPPSAAPAA
jgi:hypothetical protein